MIVAVTGGTGFVGSAIVSELLERGHLVRILSRRKPSVLPEGASHYPGSVVTGEGLRPFLAEAEAVVHLVGIIREAGTNTFEAVHHGGTVHVLEAAVETGVHRYLHMSALGTRDGAQSLYHRTKWAGEEAVRASGLSWTIFRPSIIFGPGDAFINMLAGLMRWTPLMPVIGGGSNRMQPVFIEDVARAFAATLENPRCAGKTYELAGPEVLTFRQILNTTANVVGKKRLYIPVPAAIARPAVSLFQALGIPVPLTGDQLTMLMEDNIRRDGDPLEDLGVDWTPFEEGIKQYLVSGV